MEKFENKKGEIGVVFSPGFGAGWSTWASPEHRNFLTMDVEIVSAIIDGDYQLAADIARMAIPDIYTGGAEGLIVGWVEKGEQFEIIEYDGSERLVIIGQTIHQVA